MKQIKLTQGKYAIVDDEDFHYLSRFNWQYVNVKGVETVRRGITIRNELRLIHLEDYIVARPQGTKHLFIFKNGNKLDFRKENIDFQSAEGSTHKGRKCKTVKGNAPLSKYKGVSLCRGRYKDIPLEKIKEYRKVWRAQIEKGVRGSENYKRYIKAFDTEKEAVEFYNEKARELFGKYAYQNKIKE